jgi:hypothetical protein
MVPNGKSLSFLALFTFFLISILLLSPQVSFAQACSNAGDDCDVDGDCNDGNICNGTELCFASGGVDTFSSPTCHCGTPPAPLTPCGDDAVFCNGINVCDDGQTCVAEDTLFQNPRCGANGECADFCDEATDTCADPINTPCTDDDGNICTTSACNGSGSCISSPNDFLCDDGVNCTSGDVCSGGACNGAPVQCDDTITCTLDTCDEPTGLCQFDNGQCECQADADCDDANSCTDEFCCLPGLCNQGTPFSCIRSNNTDPCDDGLFCNGTDDCSGGTCSVHSGDPCIDGEQCDSTCNESADSCFATVGTACDDDNFLTTTECDGNGKCATVATMNTQGSTLGCSLNTGEGGRFDLVLLGYAAALGSLVLRAKKKAASS